MDRINILIIDPSEIIRQGLISMLKTRSFRYELKGLTELSDLQDQIRQNWPEIVVINPSVYIDNKGDRIRLLRQDAINYGFKLVALVYAYFDEQVLSLFDETIFINDDEEKVFGKLERILAAEAAQGNEVENANLSQREMDVIRLIALGHSNRDIAEELHISIHTVISHRKNITAKLGIKSASGLTIYAVINKLIGTDDFSKTI